MAEQAAAAPTPQPVADTNQVSFGSYKQNVKASGKSVKDVKAFIKGFYNVPDDAQAYVNYQKVDENYELKAGEALQFHRPAGDKG